MQSGFAPAFPRSEFLSTMAYLSFIRSKCSVRQHLLSPTVILEMQYTFTAIGIFSFAQMVTVPSNYLSVQIVI